jgi:hypothetical protein
MSPEHVASGEIPWEHRHRLVAVPTLAPDPAACSRQPAPDERRSATDTLRVDQRPTSMALGQPDGRGFGSPGSGAGSRVGGQDGDRYRGASLNGEASAESAAGFRRSQHAQPCGRYVRGPIAHRTVSDHAHGTRSSGPHPSLLQVHS